jgi:outer membrane lipase/esterase
MLTILRQALRAVAVLTALIDVPAQAEPTFERLVVIGDSLSDIGNAGRFSNGPVWVEELASRLGLALAPSRSGGFNFAVGGARLDPTSGPHSLRAQADHLLGMAWPSGRTLHIVYGGGNDLFAAIGREEGRRMVEGAVSSLRSIVADLVRRGATDILVPNLPDVGITPEVRAQGSAAMDDARRLTEHFNRASAVALAELANGRSRPFKLYRLDTFALAEVVRRNPSSFGFVDIRTPCNGSGRCEGSLFWDRIHPTTQAHSRLGEAALRALAE